MDGGAGGRLRPRKPPHRDCSHHRRCPGTTISYDFCAPSLGSYMFAGPAGPLVSFQPPARCDCPV